MYKVSGKLETHSHAYNLYAENFFASQLPNVSPETGERDQAVPYKVLMKFRTGLDPTQKMKPCVGCNAVPRGSGVVKVGDSLHIKKMID